MQAILEQYGIPYTETDIQKFGTGLINHTWVVNRGTEKYILQRINEQVFKEPMAIVHNIDLLAEYLAHHYPEYLFVAPLKTKNGSSVVKDAAGGYFRLVPFVKGSCSVDVVTTPEQAYAAAAQFGKFTRLLNGFDASKLNITIPDFHNLSLRYAQFLRALKNGDAQRIAAASSLIEYLQSQSGIVETYEQILQDDNFPVRVMHHDTKISNVLFDAQEHGLCVIDLDTVMPGYFISDLGDMMRTYLSPVSEEESDFDKIEVRKDFYEAIVNGYYNEMKAVMTDAEPRYFFYAGTFMIYMQALRFLTDHLLGDPYYGAKYPGHNLVRSGNQAVLLQKLQTKKSLLEGRGMRNS
ncbi:MAG TPA: aminoglycoside phosphotransferase family protein [Phnomibacter sp.]|nr:aminoglycoside phosphotransferase family protein [Phnomibacter sp.]